MTPLAIRSRLFRWPGHVSLAALEALAWGELGTTRARHAYRHLRVCRACRSRLAWIRDLPAALERATRLALLEDERGILARRARGERMILPVRRASREGAGTTRAGGAVNPRGDGRGRR